MNPIYDIPNLLTLLRILLIPVFLVVFYLQTPWAREAATAVFVLAAVTDWLDGYLAGVVGAVRSEDIGGSGRSGNHWT